jgi:hypothetical protein
MTAALVNRWNAKTPRAWKVAQRIFMAIASLGAMAATMPVPVPAWLGWTIFGANALLAIATQLTGQAETENPQPE